MGIFLSVHSWYFWIHLFLKLHMKFYYLSTSPNQQGQFEVHDRDCDLIPSAYDRDYLGPFNTGQEALRKGKSLNKMAVVCPKCGADKPVAIFIK